MSGLVDRLDRDAQAWQASREGDRIVGTVLEVLERDGKFSTFTVLVVDAELVTVDGHPAAAGEWEIPAARAVLADEIRRRHVRPGDSIGVRYLGEKTTGGGGAAFHAFRVVHQAAPAPGAPAPDVDADPPAQDPPDRAAGAAGITPEQVERITELYNGLPLDRQAAATAWVREQFNATTWRELKRTDADTVAATLAKAAQT